ncbi:hypothetical protein PC39_08829 [Salinisphaera sp. PC39]|uniref:hypothetical protein n=1 Tax=Salinisphaera sp. PC39 TaxID=1304156 RepID=UPI0033419225
MPRSAFAYSDEDTARARERLVGKWYGKVTHEDGTVQRWLVHRAEDGTYLIHFRVTAPDGEIRDSREIGMWGIRMPIYFTSVQYFVEDDRAMPADTRRPALYDAYRVQKLTDDIFRYRSYRSGTRFEVRKVAPDFEMPAAPDEQGGDNP